MPLVRYEIRSEYELANRDLYRTAPKNDPEAILEGVAMVSLVGIVRQLGDLAEFAADVFHDLHEAVMATASRSHDLAARVTQLEGELPGIEKALFSKKANQVQYAYASGAEWHASIRNDQNHYTQGDLPRFIRSSYEECRGPPRLFLLDKFDVQGAGACLKRYTDPSFFKMEWASSELMKAEKAQQNKKTRKGKKKARVRKDAEGADFRPSVQFQPRVRYASVSSSSIDGLSEATTPLTTMAFDDDQVKRSLPKSVRRLRLRTNPSERELTPQKEHTAEQAVHVHETPRESSEQYLDAMATMESETDSEPRKEQRLKPQVDLMRVDNDDGDAFFEDARNSTETESKYSVDLTPIPVDIQKVNTDEKDPLCEPSEDVHAESESVLLLPMTPSEAAKEDVEVSPGVLHEDMVKEVEEHSVEEDKPLLEEKEDRFSSYLAVDTERESYQQENEQEQTICESDLSDEDVPVIVLEGVTQLENRDSGAGAKDGTSTQVDTVDVGEVEEVEGWAVELVNAVKTDEKVTFEEPVQEAAYLEDATTAKPVETGALETLTETPPRSSTAESVPEFLKAPPAPETTSETYRNAELDMDDEKFRTISGMEDFESANSDMDPDYQSSRFSDAALSDDFNFRDDAENGIDNLRSLQVDNEAILLIGSELQGNREVNLRTTEVDDANDNENSRTSQLENEDEDSSVTLFHMSHLERDAGGNLPENEVEESLGVETHKEDIIDSSTVERGSQEHEFLADSPKRTLETVSSSASPLLLSPEVKKPTAEILFSSASPLLVRPEANGVAPLLKLETLASASPLNSDSSNASSPKSPVFSALDAPMSPVRAERDDLKELNNLTPTSPTSTFHPTPFSQVLDLPPLPLPPLRWLGTLPVVGRSFAPSSSRAMKLTEQREAPVETQKLDDMMLPVVREEASSSFRPEEATPEAEQVRGTVCSLNPFERQMDEPLEDKAPVATESGETMARFSPEEASSSLSKEAIPELKEVTGTVRSLDPFERQIDSPWEDKTQESVARGALPQEQNEPSDMQDVSIDQLAPMHGKDIRGLGDRSEAVTTAPQLGAAETLDEDDLLPRSWGSFVTLEDHPGDYISNLETHTDERDVETTILDQDGTRQKLPPTPPQAAIPDDVPDDVMVQHEAVHQREEETYTNEDIHQREEEIYINEAIQQREEKTFETVESGDATEVASGKETFLESSTAAQQVDCAAAYVSSPIKQQVDESSPVEQPDFKTSTGEPGDVIVPGMDHNKVEMSESVNTSDHTSMDDCKAQQQDDNTAAACREEKAKSTTKRDQQQVGGDASSIQQRGAGNNERGQAPEAPPFHLIPSPVRQPPDPLSTVRLKDDALLEAISSHDRSKLKKVASDLRSPTGSGELLEQIRSKSFSLRHTVAEKKDRKETPPRIVANVNVAAILEKANAIRQAFAGSDDDDDDDWSDD